VESASHLGVDTGGTFTDFVLFDGARLRIHKVLSTPDAPERAILQGIAELGLDLQDFCLVHGSTVATNAVLEGKGVRTVYITNRGLADILTIGRQARQALYDLQPDPVEPPVAAECCLETGGRLGADGQWVEPLTDEDLQAVRSGVERLNPQSVAINLLFSWLNDSAEKAIEAVLPAGVFVSRSSAVLPEYREYERGIATWLNAYIGPLVQGYLSRLAARVAPAPVSVMQSSGSTVSAEQAGNLGVHLLLSGPAGGLAGAQFVARASGVSKLMTFDMGGTSTDVALIDGDICLTSEGCIGRYPVAVPMVDMHTIGAGGGSIARVDAGGLLRVGPESAGAFPGPACYGQGGEAATVTDANLVLGRLRSDAFLGGAMHLDERHAHTAIGQLAGALHISVEAAAEGIIRVANEHMARAQRVISVERGIDPQGFVLVSFGGAGGLHVCALADALRMRQALVPVNAGVLSALGMLAAARGRDLSRTLNILLADVDIGALEIIRSDLLNAGVAALRAEGVNESEVTVRYSLDLRYVGQSYTLNVPWNAAMASDAAFHRAHEARYGHQLQEPVELVNIRVNLRGTVPDLKLDAYADVEGQVEPGKTTLHGIPGTVSVWPRELIHVDQTIDGPALVTEKIATTFIAPNWNCRKDGAGNLLLSRI